MEALPTPLVHAEGGEGWKLKDDVEVTGIMLMLLLLLPKMCSRVNMVRQSVRIYLCPNVCPSVMTFGNG